MRTGCTFVFGTLLAAAGAQTSPYNGLAVAPPDTNGHYRILIGGHFHGASTSRSGYPAATLLANLDTINALGASLFLSTGDLFLDAKNDPARYARALFGKLRMPLFNAVGNHDLYRGESPVQPTFLSFAVNTAVRSWARDPIAALNEVQHAPTPAERNLLQRQADALRTAGTMTVAADRFIVFDTERDAGSIKGDQLDLLKALAEERPEPGLPAREKRIFIVSHRPIWAEEDPEYGPLFAGNTRSAIGINFRSEVYPLVRRIAEHAQVYWISGSLGGQARSSIFFQRHAPNITFIQCAVRDEPRDALLIADLYPDSVHWSALSLTGMALREPSTYDAGWWRANLGPDRGFNWRLLPYYARITVLHRAFWAGLLTASVLAIAVAGWRSRRRA